MMAVMTAEPLLALLPAETVEIGPVAGLVRDEAGGRVYVRGEVFYAWDTEDTALEWLAAVQLVERGIAKTRPVAAAFGVRDQTIWRWRQAFAEHGVAGLIVGKQGPKGASKLTEEVIGRIVALKTGGGSNRAVAAAVGVSEGSVRRAMALHRAAEDTAAPQVDAGDATAPVDGADDAAAPVGDAAGGGGAGGVEGLVVLGEPAPRVVERGLARWGLLAEAAPVC